MPRPKPKFGHGVVADGEPWPLLGCFHPSQQNTFTGKLTPPMMDAVMRQAHDAGLGRMRRYADILRSPYVAVLVASSLLARLPIGINALAIVLYLREQTGSFAIAGVVSGTLAAGSAFGAPVQGRLVDRVGARRVLVPLALVHAIGLGAIVAFAELDAPTVVLVLCGFIAGFAIPPTSSVLRSMWTDLLEPRLHQAAYALDSTLIEVVFISGPLLTAAIAAIFSPAGALIVSAIAVVVGNVVFTALPPTQHVEPEEKHERHFLGALASPGVRTLVLISLPTGVALGILEVGIPAFSRAEGAAAAAGVLLAIWSFGSGVGGLLYGTLPRHARAVPHASAGRVAAAADADPARGRAVGVGDGAARAARGLLHRAAAGDPQRARRRRRAAGHAHRGLHVADHVVRGRDRDRRRAGRRARRGAGLADGVRDRGRLRRGRRGAGRDVAPNRGCGHSLTAIRRSVLWSEWQIHSLTSPRRYASGSAAPSRHPPRPRPRRGRRSPPASTS